MSEEFNMDAALSEVADGLGFGASEEDNSGSVTESSGASVGGGVADGGGDGDAGDGGRPAPVPAGSTATPDPTPGTSTTAPTETPAETPAPRTWRPEAVASWASLPPAVKAEVLKREEDMFKGIEGYKADAKFGQAFKSVIDPHLPLLRQHNINPVAQVKGLMDAHVMLATGSAEQKAALFRKLADDYGVDIGAIPERVYVDPQVSALQKQTAQLQEKLTGWEAKAVDEARGKIQAEIDSFASDPKHTYFNEVANDMVGMLKSGAAATLKEAYDKAIWLNPATRAKEQSRINSEAAAKAKAEADEKAKAARKATSANTRTSAKAASGTAPLGTMDDTLAETLAQIKART